jgi:hypothetical protein
MVAPQVGLMDVVDQNGVGSGMRAEEVDDIFFMERWMKRCEDGIALYLEESRNGNTSEVEAGDVSRFRQPWSRGYYTPNIADSKSGHTVIQA